MILPYYKIDKTEEGKQFFFSNIGYFNFWDEYLIMNVGLDYKIYTVLVNRPKRKFSNQKVTEDYSAKTMAYLKSSIRERRPEEMFVDFPELKKFDYLNVKMD